MAKAKKEVQPTSATQEPTVKQPKLTRKQFEEKTMEELKKKNKNMDGKQIKKTIEAMWTDYSKKH